MRNIFIENHIQNVVEKLVLDPFIKNQNWTLLLINSLKYLFLPYAQVKVYQNILNWSAYLLLLPYIKLLKDKKTSGTSHPGSFSARFCEEKYFSCYILLADQIPLPDCPYFLVYWVISALQLFVY